MRPVRKPSTSVTGTLRASDMMIPASNPLLGTPTTSSTSVGMRCNPEIMSSFRSATDR
jgi:hypothetical protein